LFLYGYPQNNKIYDEINIQTLLGAQYREFPSVLLSLLLLLLLLLNFFAYVKGCNIDIWMSPLAGPNFSLAAVCPLLLQITRHVSLLHFTEFSQAKVPEGLLRERS